MVLGRAMDYFRIGRPYTEPFGHCNRASAVDGRLAVVRITRSADPNEGADGPGVGPLVDDEEDRDRRQHAHVRREHLAPFTGGAKNLYEMRVQHLLKDAELSSRMYLLVK